MKSADPSTGIQLISPPEISQTGEASVNYSFQIPSGRNGMQPSLLLHYSSDGGSGWVGHGWSIHVPSVSIDSRLGPPAFNSTIETEDYIMNGQMLVMEGNQTPSRRKIVNNAPVENSRKVNALFFERVRNGYKVITRHGSNPANYFWTEKLADGTTFYYGTTDGYQLDPRYVITSEGSSNISRWLLSQIKDKWGNYITYLYQIETIDSNITNNAFLMDGVRCYLKEIRYTGHDQDSGKYRVMFDLETQIRKDPLISHKSGFKEVDDLLLTELRVEFLNEDNTWYPVRRWKFIYDQNLSNHLIKTLLISIKEYNGSNELFYEHSMEYYKGQQIFLPEPKIIAFPKDIFNYNPDSSGNPVHQAFKTHMLYFKKKSPLKFSNTKGWSIGSSAGAGLNNSINDKSFTLDFGMSYGELKSVDRAMLTDMSGDGIPDFVIDKGFGIYAYEFDVEKEKINVRSIKKIHNLSRLGNVKTTSYDFNLGFRTADNMISIGNIKIPLETFKATGNLNMTTTRTTEYFTDYNLDGIPDFVVRTGKNLGQVYFGYYDRSGNLHFDKNSLNTHNYVIKGSQNFQLPEEQEIEKDIEIVKSWIAPFDGRIQIQGTAQIADNLTGECLIAIQHNNSFVLMPTVVNSSISHHVNEELYVRKGDYLLFRTNAGSSGHQDLLLWNPIIKYEEDVPRDANGLNYANCSYNEGFLLSGGEALFIDSSTTLRIISDEWIDSTITDTVLLRIIIEKYDENSVFISEESYEKVIIPGVSSASATFKHTATGQQAPFIGQFFNFSLPQIHHLYMKFEVNALSNVDWRKVEWRPKVIYEDVCIGEMTVFYPTVAIKTYNRVERISRPLTLDETNITLGDQVNFMPILTSNTDYSMLLPNQYHRVYFVVKSNE